MIISLRQNDSFMAMAVSTPSSSREIFPDYIVLAFADNGLTLELSGFGFEKDLYDVEFLQFDDQTIATSAVPEPRVAVFASCGFLTSPGAGGFGEQFFSTSPNNSRPSFFSISLSSDELKSQTKPMRFLTKEAGKAVDWQSCLSRTGGVPRRAGR